MLLKKKIKQNYGGTEVYGDIFEETKLFFHFMVYVYYDRPDYIRHCT